MTSPGRIGGLDACVLFPESDELVSDYRVRTRQKPSNNWSRSSIEDSKPQVGSSVGGLLLEPHSIGLM